MFKFVSLQTSLAHVIAQKCKESKQYRFVTLSATMAGVNDVKQAVKVAKNESQLTKRQTVLFIDEVHRFNKLQQVDLLFIAYRFMVEIYVELIFLDAVHLKKHFKINFGK